jgi:hypothetical protein
MMSEQSSLEIAVAEQTGYADVARAVGEKAKDIFAGKVCTKEDPMNRRSKQFLSIVSLSFVAGLFGCAGVQTSSQVYSESMKVNEPAKTKGCYDASVLLDKNFADAKAIAKKVLAGIDSTIEEETENQIDAQRNRHIGLFVGSGGEELSVALKAVSPDRTFVTVTTKTGFVGGAGQKGWSCKMVDDMVTMASR